MFTPLKPLFMQTAGDLMTAMVVMIPQNMSLQGAARLLTDSQVGGAPVVDEACRCVGVISARDFVRWASKEGGIRQQHGSADCVCSSWQIVEPSEVPHDQEVRTLMTPDPVTVIRTALIQELAQKMLDARIHRVIVVDKQQRPVGIVSSTDILAAVTRAGDFAHQAAETAPLRERY
jgi:CBS domain-containing protein